ncbi:MAG: sigma-70 family RNA polymerase sigma factor [Planctomycetota bacterium]|nr:sigma-70 family RNA polymerase sigma factor [Planctomycetota bacterium]
MSSKDERSDSITTLLLEWQATADERHLESLLRMSSDLLWQTARTMLIRCGVADPAAADDAVALVLDHVRRLPGTAAHEQQVSQFRPRRSAQNADPGEAYLIWLSKERARDVARRRRSRARHMQPLSAIEANSLLTPLQTLVGSSTADADDLLRLEQAIDGLKDRQATVIRMLITGRNQARIAAELNVCEGTVSRLRNRAIARLRHLLAK